MTATAHRLITPHLGKQAAVFHPNTPRLSLVLPGRLPSPPPAVDYGKRFDSWPLWRNGDQLNNHQQTIPGLSDCVAVATASAIRVLTANRGGEILLTDDQVVNNIYAKNGYDPSQTDASGVNPTDQGCIEAGGDGVLDRWAKNGYDINRQAPDVLSTYGYINPRNPANVRRSIAMLGGLFIGLQLPDYAMYPGAQWIAPTQSYKIAGGHGIFIHGYDQDNLYFSTWAARKAMSWQFFTMFCDESYGLLHRDWISPLGLSPANENFSQLVAEVNAARAA